MVPKSQGCMLRARWLVFATRGLLAALVIMLAGHALAAPVRWSQNGHFYDTIAVPGGITCQDAQGNALARGGYLATIPSAAEHNVIFRNLMNNAALWHFNCDPPFEHLAAGPWIGAF